MDVMELRRRLLQEKHDTSVLYKLPKPTVFDGTISKIIDTGVALLPSDRELTILIDFTPDVCTTRTFVFYAGDYGRPYYWVGIENQKGAAGWALGGYPDYVVMPNVTANTRCRATFRKSSGSNTFALSYRAGNDAVVETNNAFRAVSQHQAIIGGYDTSGNYAFKGTITTFIAYSRRLTDREVNKFLA